MSRWNLCVSLLSPTADGEEKCSEWHKVGVPGEARGKTREKMRENGGLWMKNGELSAEISRCSPLRTERGRRKARES